LRNHPNFSYGNLAFQSNPDFQGKPQGNYVPRQQYQSPQGNYRGGNNQGWQKKSQPTGNDQGNFSGQASSSGSEVMDMLKSMQQEMQRRNQFDDVRAQNDDIRDKAIQSLTNQMGQLVTDVANLKNNKGQLPSDTKVNPSHSNSRNVPIIHVSVSRSGKEYKTPLSSCLIEGVVEDSTGMESDDDEPTVQNSVLKENTN